MELPDKLNVVINFASKKKLDKLANKSAKEYFAIEHVARVILERISEKDALVLLKKDWRYGT